MDIGLKKRVLVVDDDASIRRSLEITLNKAGYAVTPARNGAEAVRLWRDLGTDLVILDLFMDEKDGIETIVELRAHSPGIRIIAMSGGGKDGNRLDLLKDAKLLGAVQTIEKPFTPEQMLAPVARVLGESASGER